MLVADSQGPLIRAPQRYSFSQILGVPSAHQLVEEGKTSL